MHLTAQDLLYEAFRREERELVTRLERQRMQREILETRRVEGRPAEVSESAGRARGVLASIRERRRPPATTHRRDEQIAELSRRTRVTPSPAVHR